MEFSSDTDFITEDLITRIQYFVMGRIEQEVLEAISVPDGWWQSFKAEILARVLPRDAPLKIRYRQINTRTNHYRLCPHAVSDHDQLHYAWLADPEAVNHAS